MSDTSERDAVLKEFSYLVPPSFLRGYREERMADEIVRLRDDLQKQIDTVHYLIGERTADREHWGQIETRADRAERILAALREPSLAVVADARKQYGYDQYTVGSKIMDEFRAAVAAAEREVDA